MIISVSFAETGTKGKISVGFHAAKTWNDSARRDFERACAPSFTAKSLDLPQVLELELAEDSEPASSSWLLRMQCVADPGHRRQRTAQGSGGPATHGDRGHGHARQLDCLLAPPKR